MGFLQSDVDQILAETGRMCAICGRRHKVQVHHIKPSHEGGPDTYDNAIPLCPNCHDEVHAQYAKGRVSRVYNEGELRLHLARTKTMAQQRLALRPGSATWKKDVSRLKFFSLCLDRPAFRSPFHQELSFSDFDQAMEETVLAINTGYWRTRNGDVIQRGEGKSHLVNADWREIMDDVARLIGAVRNELREALSLNRMIMSNARFERGQYDELADQFRLDASLGRSVDELRQQAVQTLNNALKEAGLNPLAALGN